MRLFVGLPMGDDAMSTISDTLSDLEPGEGWRWTRPETWHVTLAFLGEVAPEHVQDVEAIAGEAVAGESAEVGLYVAELTVKSGRMIWARLGDEPDGAVAVRGERLQSDLDAAGLPVDMKPVLPHVTLARWRGKGRKAPRREQPDLPTMDVAWTVEKAVLWRSHLGGGPARYEALASFPLA